MADSYPDFPRRRPVALLACVLLAVASARAAPYDSTAPINLEAASSDFDYRNNSLVFRRVKITQGALQVEAQEARATGLDFKDAEWQLKGAVRITVPDGRLAADEATVNFKENQIQRAVIRGRPATFEQRLKESKQLAQGRANTIEYDVRAGSVRLDGDAWLTDGRNEIRGRTLVYDVAKQRVAANPGESEPGGVRITINPQQPPTRPKPEGRGP
ncbi:MAG: lipopolysaccharide transport periplasmic protein LptA [Lysobacterales bacterium]|nr:MAG: lipopolysaccharide transport periplasmic protein LptA [Xanthomonadales bacterium]